jgi:Spy/CpxP family protein refolding chaperone
MKLPRPLVLTLGLTSGALLLPFAVQAQDPAPAATPSVSAPATDTSATASSASSSAPAEKPHADHEGRKAKLAALTPAERQQLKAVHEKAMQDPAVKAAESEKSTDHRAYQKTVHDAMLRADPSIAPILEKMHPKHGKKESAPEAQ